MAILWDVKVKSVNLESKRGDVVATRTDDQSALPPRVHNMQNTPMETPAQRALILQTIKDWDDQAKDKEEDIVAFLTDLEQTAIANLTAWEATR